MRKARIIVPAHGKQAEPRGQQRLQDYELGLETSELELSPRELEVLQNIALGMTQGEIAFLLGITLHTVNTYTSRARMKSKSKTTAAAACFALRRGLIT